MIIFDIDGVLSDSTDREQKYLIGKERNEIDWDLFYRYVMQDPPILSGIVTAKAFLKLLHSNEVLFLTGRNESVRSETLKWLSYYLETPEENINLIMRPEYNHTSNSKFKESIGEKIGFENIDIAFDDNGSTVDMWRSHGVKCFQTDKRDFKQNNY
jgi:hypothetical protein